VHFVFDVPGVHEEPKFTFSKATRKWQLEGNFCPFPPLPFQDPPPAASADAEGLCSVLVWLPPPSRKGYRPERGLNCVVQQRWQGKFSVRGTLPPSVDVSATPKAVLANGTYHISIHEFVD
jgi:hypothetical protein